LQLILANPRADKASFLSALHGLNLLIDFFRKPSLGGHDWLIQENFPTIPMRLDLRPAEVVLVADNIFF
jgi:hypothetical protein